MTSRLVATQLSHKQTVKHNYFHYKKEFYFYKNSPHVSADKPNIRWSSYKKSTKEDTFL